MPRKGKQWGWKWEGKVFKHLILPNQQWNDTFANVLISFIKALFISNNKDNVQNVLIFVHNWHFRRIKNLAFPLLHGLWNVRVPTCVEWIREKICTNVHHFLLGSEGNRSRKLSHESNPGYLTKNITVSLGGCTISTTVEA